MQDRLAARLENLRQEYQTGQAMLADLEAKQLDLRQTLLRIAGAIQVLEELLAAAEASGPGLTASAAHHVQGAGAEAPGRTGQSADQVTEADKPGAEPAVGHAEDATGQAARR